MITIRKNKIEGLESIQYLNGILDSKASNGVAARKAVGDGKFREGIIPPEAARARFSDDLPKLPRRNESLNLHLAIGGHRPPEARDACGTSEVGERQLLEYGAESVLAQES